MRFKSLKFDNSFGVRSSWLCLAVSLSAMPAFAQPEAVEDANVADETENKQDLVITGTRLVGFSAPTPVTSIGQQDLEAKAIRSVTDLMMDVPTLRFNQNNGQVSAPIGASNLDLRGLGSSRTLLLLDGRRFAATDSSGGVDVSVIPAVLINKVEIVTGGASAAYGSDAVSGVVNISLDSRLEGVKGSVQYSETTYGDHRQPGASLAVGKSALGGRLHVIAAGDFYRNTGQLDQSTRPWGSHNYAVLTNPAYTTTNGQPQRLILPNSTTTQLISGGVTALNSPAALRGIQFGPGGTVLPFDFGTNVGSSFMTGGDGGTPMATANITPRYTRYAGFGRVSFDFTDDTSIFADALWSRSEAFTDQNPNIDSGTIVLRRDNAFMPASIRDLIPANGTLTIGRINEEDGTLSTTTIATVRRYALGIEGTFGAGWQYSAYAQISRNLYERADASNRINARWLNAIDAVINPATGQPACRINVDASTTNDDPACVPSNLFGPGSVSAAAVAYYIGTSTSRSEQRQNVYAANISGSPMSLPAGDIQLALGAEYRTEEVSQVSDPISQASGWRQINAQTLSGRFNVKELYGEIGVPVLKDSAIAEELDVSGALRLTDYSTSGSVTTWKVGSTYTPVRGIRFRGTVSRDIRAPNVNELFSGQASGRPIVIDTSFTPARSSTVNQLTGGNTALKPEKAKTYTVGVVLEPLFLPRFHLSIDYYTISIDSAILAPTAQQVVDGCNIGVTAFCSAITRDPATNVITDVRATLLNAATFKTKGVDIEAEYSFPVGEGSVTARALANYVSTLYNSVNGETAGQTGSGTGIPHWRGNISLSYRTNNYLFGILGRYVQGGVYNSLYFEGGGPNSINNNHVGGRAYIDVNGSYKITPEVEIFAKVNNLLDNDPPITPQVITGASAAGSPFYDRVGRLLTGGVRFRF
ncbi:TonB-dependent receptor-like protein [Sphingobium sp. SYK-6]|nr:TonB-dependent receptor-like protein [Sphingobium sp. SYK-6]